MLYEHLNMALFIHVVKYLTVQSWASEQPGNIAYIELLTKPKAMRQSLLITIKVRKHI